MTGTMLSLVFPAFNEADNLPHLLESAVSIGERLGLPFEIVIVDDGSRDHSAELLSGWCTRDSRVRAVHHAANRGYGAALRSGLREARGDLVFFSDADLQFDLAEIRHLLEHAEEFEIVAGYRAPRRDYWLRRGIARAWGLLVGTLFDLRVRDIDCAFKVFRRDVLQVIPIESIGAFVNTEILVRARAAGFRIKQVPVSHRRRRQGRQTGARPRVIGRALLELFQLYRELRHDLRHGAPRPLRREMRPEMRREPPREWQRERRSPRRQHRRPAAQPTPSSSDSRPTPSHPVTLGGPARAPCLAPAAVGGGTPTASDPLARPDDEAGSAVAAAAAASAAGSGAAARPSSRLGSAR